MNKFVRILFACLLPFGALAQPVINNAEGYDIGDVISFGNCGGVAAGPAGAAQVWNFAGLAQSDVVTLQVLATPPSSVYRNADRLEKFSDGVNYFMRILPGQNYIAGMIDSSFIGNNDSATYLDNVQSVVRPFSYGSVATDNFTLQTFKKDVVGKVAGTGTIVLTGDGYGSLQLPNGTFNDVLRVKVNEQSSYQLGPGGGTIDQTIHTYKWYNNTSKAPLLRIDSLVGTYHPKTGPDITQSLVKVRYLLSAKNVTSVPVTDRQNANYSANIQNNQLTLFGSFDHNQAYVVMMYNSIGQKVFSESFTANSKEAKFDIGCEISSGMYVVYLLKGNEIGLGEVIKVVKP